MTLVPQLIEGGANQEAPGFRQPPHNLEAEQQLLGTILLNNRALERVSEFLLPEHFAHALHGRIFEACQKLIELGNVVTVVTLKAYLENDPLLKEAGGVGYLARLAEAVVTTVNADEYGRQIHDFALRRTLIDMGQEMVNDAFEITIDRTALNQIEGMEQKLYDLATTGRQEGGFQDFATALTTAIQMAEAAHRREGQLAGVPTDLIDLD
ncbi:MAG: DnaB-like helicase N-terminal domain-containing protein, partial [Rhodospirillaceae bacterium]